MKVLKFGGTSVGSVKSIRSIKAIVEKEARHQSVVVIVSALSGIHDILLKIADMALANDKSYRLEFDKIVERHHSMIDTIIVNPQKRINLINKVDTLFDQLKSIYYGVFLIRDLSEKTLDTIVSYGELLSSLITATLIKKAEWLDARDFIKTRRKNNRHSLDSDITNDLVSKALADAPRITVIPGFISRDIDSDETTNLGRGGSDYTAAIIAAALNADILEIWTDTDGFMTADPLVIPAAYRIDELSYVEATELCNFGAKVLYPPTIYPVCVKNIPILIKNTFNQDSPGTLITDNAANDGKPIKGISSINDTTLITVTGLSMVGVIGINRRIFSALADHGISVFLVSQASSENSTSIGVKDTDAIKAVNVLNSEFAKEIKTGSMYPMHFQSGLATVAIVGQNMKNTPGNAGKLFGTLGRSGISVIACAQGASETNISFVVTSNHLRKALNVIHDSFFLSEYNVLNLFICGTGVVGGKLLDRIHQQSEELRNTRRLQLNVVGIANSRRALFNRDGINLNNYKEALEKADSIDTESLRKKIIEMNIYNAVFVDCTASTAVAGIYGSLLQNNVSVVAANKIAASSDYANYISLKETALSRGVKFRYETNVGAGLPIINTINDLRNSGDQILKIEAVLSGTLNFIFNELSATVPFSEAVRRAKMQGFSEPDPRIDLSGMDVIRKLVILTREAGYKINTEDVTRQLIIPERISDGSIEDFWRKLPEIDRKFEDQRLKLEAEGKRWRFVATMDNGQANVELRAVDRNHPFYNLEGSNNIVLLTTECYREYPMQIKGYGAGASVTAVGVFANVMSIANI